jgi:hypothetical protein
MVSEDQKFYGKGRGKGRGGGGEGHLAFLPVPPLLTADA